MKQFEISALGLEEMSLQEARTADGGVAAWVIIGTVMTAISIVDFICDVAKGYKEEVERLSSAE